MFSLEHYIRVRNYISVALAQSTTNKENLVVLINNIGPEQQRDNYLRCFK